MIAWPLLALLAAGCETGRDLAARRMLRQGRLSSRLVMGGSALLSAALMLPLALRAAHPFQGQALALSLLATAVVNGVAFWSYGRALAAGDLSVVLPLINLSPVVLLFTAWWLLGERPGSLAVAGVILVVLGALLLGRASGPSRADDGPSAGLQALWRARGARAMLLVAVLWGLGASIDKLGVQAGGSLTWVVGLNLVVGMPLALPATAAGEGRGLGSWWLWLLLVGGLGAFGMTMQMEALQQTAVVHVIAIKRLSTLFSALIGVLWLGEPLGPLRVPAAGLMLLGAVLVLSMAAR